MVLSYPQHCKIVRDRLKKGSVAINEEVLPSRGSLPGAFLIGVRFLGYNIEICTQRAIDIFVESSW